ncbi:MAG: hypothetical protein ACLRXQ_00145 [Phascolarctobacterium faecium]
MYRWIIQIKEQRRDPNAQMNVQLNLDNARLGILQVISPMVEWGVVKRRGRLNWQVRLRTFGYGAVKIPDGS